MIPSSKNRWIALASIVAVSVALELYGRSCGFIITSDSRQFLSAAKSFSEQGEFLSPDGSYYSFWQPLFPIILSMTREPLVLLGWLNVVCKIVLAAVLIGISGKILERFFIKVIFVALSLCSVATMMLSVFVWSDFLFMTLAYLTLYLALNPDKKYFFSMLVVTGFLMCIQRNAGLFWISGICLWFLFDKEVALPKRFFRAAIFFLITTSGLWAWNIYNTFFIPANFAFHRHPFFLDWRYNWKLIGETFSKLVVPLKNGLLSFLGVLILPCILWNKCSRELLLIVCLLAMYMIGYACMVKLDRYEMQRYFAPVFPLAFLLMLRAIESVREGKSTRTRYAIIIVLCGWLVYPAFRTIKNVQAWRERSCLENPIAHE